MKIQPDVSSISQEVPAAGLNTRSFNKCSNTAELRYFNGGPR